VPAVAVAAAASLLGPSSASSAGSALALSTQMQLLTTWTCTVLPLAVHATQLISTWKVEALRKVQLDSQI
jgi:hypothetical protein